MAIGITGASGQLGVRTLEHLLARVAASDVVAVTRHPEKVQAFSERGVRVRAGDFDRPSDLPRAFEGVERLLIIPTSELQPNARPRQHLAAVKAAAQAGVRRIVYVSSVGARPSGADGILETHFTTEQAVIASGTPWTVLRMGPYADFLVDAARRAIATGTYTAQAGAPAAYVTRDDVAAAAAGILATGGHEGVTYHATGPVAVTGIGIADTLSRISGTPVTFVPQSEQEYKAGLVAAALPGFVIDALARFQAALRDGAFDLVTGDVERLAGVGAEAAADFLARQLQPAHARAHA